MRRERWSVGNVRVTRCHPPAAGPPSLRPRRPCLPFAAPPRRRWRCPTPPTARAQTWAAPAAEPSPWRPSRRRTLRPPAPRLGAAPACCRRQQLERFPPATAAETALLVGLRTLTLVAPPRGAPPPGRSACLDADAVVVFVQHVVEAVAVQCVASFCERDAALVNEPAAVVAVAADVEAESSPTRRRRCLRLRAARSRLRRRRRWQHGRVSVRDWASGTSGPRAMYSSGGDVDTDRLATWLTCRCRSRTPRRHSDVSGQRRVAPRRASVGAESRACAPAPGQVQIALTLVWYTSSSWGGGG